METASFPVEIRVPAFKLNQVDMFARVRLCAAVCGGAVLERAALVANCSLSHTHTLSLSLLSLSLSLYHLHLLVSVSIAPSISLSLSLSYMCNVCVCVYLSFYL